MPRYEYQCNKCNFQLIVTRPIYKDDDVVNTQCYHCDGTWKRVFAAAPVQFKGKGFYATDSA